jgi:hypothetical protein
LDFRLVMFFVLSASFCLFVFSIMGCSLYILGVLTSVFLDLFVFVLSFLFLSFRVLVFLRYSPVQFWHVPILSLFFWVCVLVFLRICWFFFSSLFVWYS